MSAKRPSPWWSSQTVAKERFSRMKNVGAPCESRSLVSGRPRQISRTEARIRCFVTARFCRSAQDRSENARQLRSEPRLPDVIVRAGVADLEDSFLVVVPADCDDGKTWPALAQLPRRLDAVEDRHLDVHHDGIGLHERRERHCVLPVAGAPGHGEAAVLLEKERDRVEERFVVLGNENAEHPFRLPR